jgi:hypothetical protein
MSELKEFAINLPMTSIGATCSAIPQSAAVTGYDITADTTVPPDVSPECSHINVSVDSATITSYDANSPFVNVDLVLNVNIWQDANGSQSRNHKVIKRLSMDRVKLALQAESSEYQVVEQEDDPAEVEKMMTEFYAAKRARELVGIPESAGVRTFDVLFKYRDKDGKSWASGTVTVKSLRDAAHARHVFDAHHAAKYPEVKITRVTEVTPKE